MFALSRYIDAAGIGAGGLRILCAGRHTREKSQDRIVRIFARHVLPSEPDAVLVMVGAGPDTGYYERVAEDLVPRHRGFDWFQAATPGALEEYPG